MQLTRTSISYLAPDMMPARQGSVPSLDGLRAISILIVLLAHFVDDQLFPGGVGVYVFFVISGFLITRLLFAERKRTGTVQLQFFYFRRILRLYPVIIAFSIFVVGARILASRPYNLIEPASALGYFSNYLYVYYYNHGIPPVMPFEVFWSLSIEEHFYILFPVTFLLLHGNPRRLVWTLAGLCAACLGLRLFMAWLHPEYLHTLDFYLCSQYRLDSIGFGVLIAIGCEMEAGRQFLRSLAHPAIAAGSAALVLLCLVVRDPWFRETLRYSFLGIGIAALVSAILFSPRYAWAHWVLNTALFRWVGRLSYSLYVWHEGVASFLPVRDLPLWQQASIKLLTAFAVASISYYAVERPFLSLRGHFQLRRASQPFSAVARPGH